MSHLKHILAIALLIGLSCAAVAPRAIAAVTVPSSPVAEGTDFATRVLRDPWDMSEFTDVSMDLNYSGQRNLVQNISVADGVFSATSTEEKDADFVVLFPGYAEADPSNSTIKVIGANPGAHYPIPAATYRCLYIAANVQTSGTDYLQVFWFADERQNAPGGIFGGGTMQAVDGWRVYQMDLANPPLGSFETPWTGQPLWRGLRIDPTVQANVPFSVDWVRLTDCNASTKTISFTPDASVSALWVRPQGATRDILVATNVNGASGSYDLDVQSLAPGAYEVGLGTASSCCASRSTTPLVINQTPFGSFTQPSATSGVDYATQAGNPWDFTDSVDASVQADRGSVTAGYQNGVLDIVTPSGPTPAGVDVQVKLKAPVPASSSEYRYLTFRMYTEWKAPWSNVPDGMIARWIWSIQGTSGRQGRFCHLVSNDIPYDIGWQTYTIDLFTQGRVEESGGECPAGVSTWADSGSVLAMRFDPNENITEIADPITGGGPFHQQIDFIKLTKENVVNKGAPYMVQLSLNKPVGQITSHTFYYTTNPQEPTQNVAKNLTVPPPAGSNQVHLPIIAHGTGGAEPGANPLWFVWDTQDVAPGTYYLCTQLNDGINSNIVCSDVPVKVQ